MTPDLSASHFPASLLNSRFRGHDTRDWSDWQAHHAYSFANEIPATSDRAWIGRNKLNYRGLRERTGLRHLIASNVDQHFLDEIGELRELERLELEWPFVATDLSPLLRLQRLKFLSIDSPRRIANFEILTRLESLRTLLVTNAKKMTGLDWLAGADHLEVVGIEGGMWSPYTIPTLEPVGGLRSLRAFLATSTNLADRRLMPLAECPNLSFLGIACVAPRHEFMRLQQSAPGLVCDWFRDEAWRTLSG